MASIRHLHPSRLKPHESNTRLHDEMQLADLARSIRQFGFVKPIIADENLTILAGHGVWLAATNMDLEEVPVLQKKDLSEEIADLEASETVERELNELKSRRSQGRHGG